MENQNFTNDPYLYIRGFLITKSNLKKPECIHKSWTEQSFGLNNEYKIYYDTRNEVCYKTNKNNFVFVLGKVLDTSLSVQQIKQNTLEIITTNLLTHLKQSEDNLFEYVEKLGGRHIIVFGDKNHTKIINDATGMKSVYYHEKEFFVASHFNLIHDITNDEEFELHQECLALRRKKSYCVYLPGDATPHKNIRILIPNHYFNFEEKSISRFFPKPDSFNKNYSVDEISEIIADRIKNQYETIAQNHDIVHSLTAGCDSRVSLAAAKNIKDKITCFTYHNEIVSDKDAENVDREMNFLFAKDVCEKEGVKYFDFYVDGPRDENLMKIMDRNAYHKHNRLIKQVSEKYNFTDKTIHLRSAMVEFCRNLSHAFTNYGFNDIYKKFINWANFHDLRDIVLPYFEESLKRNQTQEFADLVSKTNHSMIFYWEQRLPLWMNAGVCVDNDILCDTYMLFNVREIIKLCFMIPTYIRDTNSLVYKIINILWPELLNYKLPNETTPTYKLVDNEFADAVQISDCKLNSGSLSKIKIVSPFFEDRKFGARFGFGNSFVEKDDFVEIIYNLPVEKGLAYYYEINLMTYWNVNAPQNIAKYSILIDNRQVYGEFTNNFNNRTNQILVGFTATETKTIQLKIRLTALADCKDLDYLGVINLKSMYAKREWVKKFPETPVVSSTRERYFNL